jgi:DNA-binding MarR family transcriptional regulator
MTAASSAASSAAAAADPAAARVRRRPCAPEFMQPSCIPALLCIVVAQKSTPAPYLFGDLLALARRSWIRQMAARLERLGYADYHRSDAASLRVLRRGPIAVGRLAGTLDVTRQAARKLVAGLERRAYARTERDAHDSRKLNVVLTARGEAYAAAVVQTIEALNRELGERVDAAQLAAADAVLRAVIDDDGAGQHSPRLVAAPA